MREIGLGSLIKDLERNMYAKVVLFNKDETIDLRYENEDIQWLTKNGKRFKVVSNFRIGDRVIATNQFTVSVNGEEGIVVGFNENSNNPLVKYKFELPSFHNGHGNELFHYESDKNDCWYVNEECLTLVENQKFNWEEFISNDNIVVHCATEEQATDFCKQMHEHGLEWSTGGQSYLKKTYWKAYKKETCYTGYGTYADLEHYKNNNYTILEWSNYEKENNMNLELANLTEEQKNQIIELAKKFEQENEVDKLDYDKDWKVYNMNGGVERTNCRARSFSEELFKIGLTAHTKEEAEKIRRRLLVEKELRDWSKKCKKPIDIKNQCQAKFILIYDVDSNRVVSAWNKSYIYTEIMFTDEKTIKQAIESIGQERLIRDYFGIDK